MPMDSPGSGDVHVDALLTGISVGYANAIYIAGQIFPAVLVLKRSDIVPKYTKSDWFRDEAKELSEREAPPVTGYNVDTTDTYYCREYGIGHFIGDARRANTDRPFDADRDATRWVSDKLQLREERLFVSNFWTTGVWAEDKEGTVDFTKWSTYGTSTPIVDLRGFGRTIRRGLGGLTPNTLVLGDLTFDVLSDHPNMLDRIKYSSSANAPAMVSPNLIAQLLGLNRVLVGVSMYTASPEGTAEASVAYTPNWDDDGLLAYVAPRPSLFNPSAGYNFVWRTAMGGPRYVKRRRDPQSDKGELIEGFQYMDPKAVATDAGLFIKDAVD
jgi:hypothetical protein